MKAAMVSHTPMPAPSPSVAEEISKKTLAPGQACERRVAISFIFVALCGSPPESEWAGHDGVISEICKRLDIDSNSRASVKKVLHDVVAAGETAEKYDPSAGCRERGVASALILPGSTEARLVYDAKRAGLSITETAVLVNEVRGAIGLEEICWSAVQGFIERDPIIKVLTRETKKSGKTDPTCDWARARLAQVSEWKLRLSMEYPTQVPGGVAMPLCLHALVIWDEHHREARLGHASRKEAFVAVHPETGEPCSPADGGLFPPGKATTTMKYASDARGCFGVAMRKRPDGTMEGVRCAAFNYTGQKVVGVASYQTSVDAEIRRVDNLKTCGDGSAREWGGGGYKVRFPTTWRAEVEKKLATGAPNTGGGLICVTKVGGVVCAVCVPALSPAPTRSWTPWSQRARRSTRAPTGRAPS